MATSGLVEVLSTDQKLLNLPLSGYRMNLIWLLVISGLVAIGRFTIPGVHKIVSWEDSYEAIAHIWIGWLFATCILQKNNRLIGIGLIAALSGLELALFLTSK